MDTFLIRSGAGYFAGVVRDEARGTATPRWVPLSGRAAKAVRFANARAASSAVETISQEVGWGVNWVWVEPFDAAAWQPDIPAIVALLDQALGKMPKWRRMWGGMNETVETAALVYLEFRAMLVTGLSPQEAIDVVRKAWSVGISKIVGYPCDWTLANMSREDEAFATGLAAIIATVKDATQQRAAEHLEKLPVVLAGMPDAASGRLRLLANAGVGFHAIAKGVGSPSDDDIALAEQCISDLRAGADALDREAATARMCAGMKVTVSVVDPDPMRKLRAIVLEAASRGVHRSPEELADLVVSLYGSVLNEDAL